MTTIELGALAHARSGDKGNHANIGVVAYTDAGFEYLQRELTTERVAEFFRGLGASRVERFELPNINALNFVLYDALVGGASMSLESGIDDGQIARHGRLRTPAARAG